mmetsp:Transcript_18294/g.51632  ORF Transcript_18294/g.51632 Transcript_18294/m.51632 type:complete len:86 (-) Transcript_18294:104-361(-)
MGKRKSRKKPMPTKSRGFEVPKVFQCPFCNHDKSVECDIDVNKGLGRLECRVCGENYQMLTTALTEPIDIFSAWIDECEEANKDD